MGRHEDNVKRHQKTTMTWDIYQLKTHMPVTDWHKPEEKHVHTIEKIVAVSLPDRRGQITVNINRVAISPRDDQAQVMADRLRQALQSEKTDVPQRDGAIFVKPPERFYNNFEITFFLHDGDAFCEAAIKIVEAIFQGLGVEDERRYNLGNFKIVQETFVRFEGNWISYAAWLRMRYDLSPLGHEFMAELRK
jgi:hypothetical protein